MSEGPRRPRLAPRLPGERLRTRTRAAFLAFWVERFRRLFDDMRAEPSDPDGG